MKYCIRLIGIENDREITNANSPQFWSIYHRAVFLALKERGILNDVQYQCAEERLKNRHWRSK